MPTRRPPVSPGALLSAIAIGLWSCQGITSNVETLRAEHLEIVDKDGALQMDVANKIRSLEERVKKLEAALEARRAEPPPAPPAPIVSAPTSASSAPPVATAQPVPSSSARAPVKPPPPHSTSAPKGGAAPEIY